MTGRSPSNRASILNGLEVGKKVSTFTDRKDRRVDKRVDRRGDRDKSMSLCVLEKSFRSPGCEGSFLSTVTFTIVFDYFTLYFVLVPKCPVDGLRKTQY